ncbi:6-pyruvoyl tetrahydropterin synthase QueD [Haloarcula virus HVTV-2]|uniref:QueD n=1 Tax=Haloarcula vallismortis tailed virus 1 TaxID=1262528 RepID=L7TKD6_9CAUD|nr:QueD-like 6-pyruvoyl-tetrahydropterin synthase [Haloarcula vallismortis tailed virus 1]AGC34445.1 QueD [Haloarcula vallismortis tailed virus 1]UBF22882.1 6-pyruvoyl tetrahydropterin synthase QueD [Haloarcula virus HVTV-2]
MSNNNIRTLEVEGHSTSTAHRLMHYDGACNNIHGHNMEWNARLKVRVPNEEHQMAVDFKDVSGVFDKYDHAILLNNDDPLLRALEEQGGTSLVTEVLGEVYTFDGDPTTELVSQVVAQELVDTFENVDRARVEIKETQKYAMASAYPDAFNEE